MRFVDEFRDADKARALSAKIKGFVQPKSWFVDFSPISMTP